MSVKPIPEGMHTVTPYLIVQGAAQLIDFLKQAFGAVETVRMDGPGGTIMHAEVRIGDSTVMISDGNERYPPMPAMIHLYVPDVDVAYKAAIAAGAKSEREPANQFYGDRSAGVVDASGNRWYMATHIEDVTPEEMKKRMKAMGS